MVLVTRSGQAGRYGELYGQPVRRSAIAVVAAAVLIAGCALAGWWLTYGGARLHLGNTFPVTGRYHLHLSAWLLAPLLVAAVVWRAQRLLPRLRWPQVLLAGYLTAVVWAVALALVGGGPEAIAEPLTTRWEYLAEVDRIDAMGIGTYLATFTDYIVEGRVSGAGPGWVNHVAGHPPLLTLLFVLLARAGLAGPGPAAALCIAVGAVAVPAVLETLRLLAGQDWARRAVPFVAAAPLALWMATSADAIIAGVAAAGIAILAHAAAAGTRRAVVALAGLAGVLLGGALMLSYGMVLLAPVAVAVVIGVRGWRRAWLPALAGLIGTLAVLAAFAAAGFWWLEGLGLTAHRVRIGEGWSQRPTGYFLFANPAALAVAVGPAVVAALPQMAQCRRMLQCQQMSQRQRLALPAMAALVAVAAATASTLSKGEVERIWLPFAVWLLGLAALLPRPAPPPAEPGGRGWLAAHLGWPIVVAAGTTLTW